MYLKIKSVKLVYINFAFKTLEQFNTKMYLVCPSISVG